MVADSPEQALELENKLSQLPAVATNISMAPFLTGDVTEKLKLIGEIKKEIAPVHFQPADPEPVDADGIGPDALFHVWATWVPRRTR